MFQIRDNAGKIRGRCEIIDEIVLHTGESIAIAYFFVGGDVLVEDLPDDVLNICGFCVGIVIFQRFREPAVCEIVAEGLRYRNFRFV